jgi:hypothetical protein
LAQMQRNCAAFLGILHVALQHKCCTLAQETLHHDTGIVALWRKDCCTSTSRNVALWRNPPRLFPLYLANEKRRVKDRFRVFDRAVSFGEELSDGKIADKNYVWLSEWQLQSINSNHLLPIDLEAYRQLKNHIAKALVPLLQVWL